MSVDKESDGTLHLAGDTVETLLLALCCLEAMWRAYPDVVKKVAIESGMPDLAEKGGEASMLITAFMALR